MKSLAQSIAIFVLVLSVAIPANISAARLTFVSDLISTSAPTTDATHTIQFTIVATIPAGGRIIITPQNSAFTIPAALNYTDMHLAVSSGGGPYIARSLSAVASALDDGITVVSGTTGSITITLNSSVGIIAGDSVQLIIDGGGTGSLINNPSFVQSYSIYIDTQTSLGVRIDNANAMIAVVAPVGLELPTAVLRPSLFNGLPGGELPAGTRAIELSLETVDPAICRYATSSGMGYGSMTNTFSSIGGTFFLTTAYGFQDGMTYTFYVRCINQYNNPNDVDFPISFFLDPTPDNTNTIGTTPSTTSVPIGPTGSLGPGGEGNFPNGSAYLYLANVTLSGLSVPLSTVTILRDGVVAGTTHAQSDGTFSSAVVGLERGVYSFSAHTQDTDGNISSSYSSTLTVGSATNNTISNIIIPPTLVLSTNSISPGDPLALSGWSIPDANIKISLTPQAGSVGGIATYHATTSASGAWQMPFDTSILSDGSYLVSAIAIESNHTQSSVSAPVILTVGPGTSACGASPDLNADKKVNLVDFSIFLTMWQTTNGRGDFNCDGTVNLSDFSIMLFNWTG